MPADLTPDDAHPPRSEVALDARAELQRSQAAMAAATGGVAPARVLVELAQELAGELAQHFDELPMHRFTGFLPGPRLLRWVTFRRMPHRVVMGRYLDLSFPRKVAEGWNRQYAHIAVLALGADGVLRVGTTRVFVRIPQDNPVLTGAKRWNHLHLGRVPTHALALAPWDGGQDARQVARPREVIDALTEIAAAMSAEIGKDLDVMRRFGITDG
jgi:hypothetical protein